jgi:hypothetical protein
MCCSTEGTIHVSYSYVHRTTSEPTEVFHARQISYPVMVTVYHMLECHAMDILPYSRLNEDDTMQVEKTNTNLQPTLRVDDEVSWCLFSIEVRNTYGLPFNVTFDRSQESWCAHIPCVSNPHLSFASTDTSDVSVTVTIPPGSTKR